MYFDFLFQSICDIRLLCSEKEVNDALLGITQLFYSDDLLMPRRLRPMAILVHVNVLQRSASVDHA